ncbi:hypothetical protein P3X46_017019 [Hevea brasiliensis]|uniref:RNase H type-1 domain-containing protein n=1 Tax=Hevea brasiliensis TaxID=3981 RepID=A0ABQ9M158_HEVBR|nr:hypothetical protein P3X46_017019 [Hevea brasiliensis]
MTRKAVKGSVIADLLAENPIQDYEALDFEFPDEHVNEVDRGEEGPADIWEMYFDGAVNLSVAIEMKVRKLEVYGDSALIIYQVKGEWQTKDPKLIPYQKYLLELIKKFEEISFTHLSRDKNQFADALATLAVMAQMEEGQTTQVLKIKARNEPVYCFMIEEEPDGKPWYHDILLYIRTREFPSGASKNEKRMIQRLALGYFPSGETLYKRSSNGELLRCVDAKEAKRILFETHEGNCATHANGHMMAKQIMRRGYFGLQWKRIASSIFESAISVKSTRIR